MIPVYFTSVCSSGGWVADGDWSLAHGMGVPVEDAVGSVVSENCDADCRLWVNTRDWVAPHGPGRFQVLVNGIAADKVFGIGSGEWGWVDGGVVKLRKGQNEVRLHDLTGFDGRCAGIAFVPIDSTAADVEHAWAEQEARQLCNRELVDFDVAYWTNRVFLPICATAALSLATGYCTRFFIGESFLRILITTVVCEAVLLPLAWSWVFEEGERSRVVGLWRRMLAIRNYE